MTDDRIKQALRDLGMGHEPNPEWQGGVWVGIAKRERRIAMIWLVICVVSLAIAAVAWWVS